MTRALLALLAVLALWCGLATWAVLHQRGANATIKAELRQSNNALERARSAERRASHALVSLRRKNAATARETASAARSLQAAGARNPDWAAQPVPKEVQDAFK